MSMSSTDVAFSETSPSANEDHEKDDSYLHKQILGHVPDMVVDQDPDSPIPQVMETYGVLLFADISGFTALCEKYCNSAGKKSTGTDQLTTTLNSYLSKIVEAIITAEGDVIKFAGDALLAFWSCSKFEAVQTVNHVLTKCLKMQRDYDNYQTVGGSILRMKLGISVGNLDMYHIGASDYHMLDVAGEAVDDVNAAQNQCPSGAVVISPAAWDMCNKRFCIAKLVGSGFAQVSKTVNDANSAPGVSNSSLPDMILNNRRRSTLSALTRSAATARRLLTPSDPTHDPTSSVARTTDTIQEESSPFSPSKRARHSVVEVSSTSASNSTDSLPSQMIIVPKPSLDLNEYPDVRPTLHPLLKKMTHKQTKFIRTYVQKAVVDRIDHGHDASWMSELRQVCVTFINLSPQENLGRESKLNMLQMAFNAIFPPLQKYEGSLNKVFMFDKGCTFVCVFGLPHAMHEDDAQRALRAAKEAYRQLEKMDLSHFSIGVTTGTAFCGVVGHLQRHEYTVIGQKVNMAARLMMKFPNAITCDDTTRTASGLPDSHFVLMPPTKLKGISQPENIFSLVTDDVEKADSHHGLHHLLHERSTLIGRKQEMEALMSVVTAIKEQREHQTGLVAITGSGGTGKTKLLKAFKATALDLGFRVVSTTAGLVEKNTPFHIAKTLLLRLLGIDKCRNLHEREQLLLSHVTMDEQLDLLPLLNDLLVLKFPQTHTTSQLTHDERESHLHSLLLSIIHQTAADTPCLFGVDDAHLVDEQSWPFLLDLASDPNTLLVVSLKSSKLKRLHAAAIEALQTRAKVLDLVGLSQSETVELACQILDADNIPGNLEKILVEKTHGIPLWCEELISSMVESGLLQVTEEEQQETTSTKSSDNIRQSQRKRIVQFGHNVHPEDISIPDSITGIILARFDHLPPDAQLVLKCASVLGTTFSRPMLATIVPNMTEQVFTRTIASLASYGLIECYHAAQVSDLSGSLTQLTEVKCPCLLLRRQYPIMPSVAIQPVGTANHSAMFISECQFLEFVHPYVRDTLYDLWTRDQRRKLHKSAALFLESQAHKCENCGGGGFTLLGTTTTTPKPAPAKPAPTRRQSLPTRRQSLQPQGRAFVGTSIRTVIQRNRRRSSRVHPLDMPSEMETHQAIIEEGCYVNEQRRSLVESLLQRRRSSEHSTSSEDFSGMADVSFDLQDCHCDEILSKVYPQLILHWKEVGDKDKVLHYLMEAAGAAVTTFNNMEALSLLHEAQELSKEGRLTNFTQHDKAELESLVGQALFQSGDVEECLPHFRRSLQLLGSNLPEGKVGGALQLVKMAAKQLLHKHFPRLYLGSRRGLRSQNALDQARCLAHITQAYHLQHRNWQTLMSALQQLNVAEEAEENVHELIEAYSTMLECCQLHGYRSMGRYYQEKALSYCEKVEPDVNDLLSYAHFLNVSLKYSLCEGKVSEALNFGNAAIRISNTLHEVPIKVASLTMLSQAFLAANQFDQCRSTLGQLCSVVEEADDLRSQALYECSVLDSVLDTDVNPDNFEEILASAKKCSDEDFFHYDGEERFFMLAALALWHGRQLEWEELNKCLTTAKTLFPKQFETYFAVRALCWLVECELLLHQAQSRNREYRKMANQDLSLLTTLSSRLPVFKPRVHILSAFRDRISNRIWKARQHISKAKAVAKEQGNRYHYEWAERCQQSWLEADSRQTHDCHLRPHCMS